MRKLTLLLLTLLLVIALLGCSASFSTNATNWNIGSQPRNLDENLTFNASRSFNVITLKAEVQLNSGDLTFTATDAAGNVLWTETVTPGQELNETRQFDPDDHDSQGNWNLHIQANQVTGSISFQWRSNR